MKLTLLLVLLVQLVSAQDEQWMVKNGQLRQGLSYSTNSIGTNDSIYVGKIGKPNLANNPNACNSFFAIFNNGDFFLSPISNANANTINSTTVSSSDSIYYKLNNEIKFLYLTNIYEDDDPPASVAVVSSLSSFPSTENVNTSLTNETEGRLTNHDFVNEKDVTFILDSSMLDNNCTYRLEHNATLGKLIFHNSEFIDGSGNNVLRKVSSGMQSSSLTWNGNVLVIPNNLRGTNAFLNYKVSFPEELIKNSIRFQLIGRQTNGRECEIIEPWLINLSDKYHDPNYVELKCVWQEGGRKFGIYRVECFNDGPGMVDSVKLRAILPTSALPGTVEIMSWRARCKKGCGEGPEKVERREHADSNLIEVVFPYKLKGFGGKKSCKNTAWFEFKVEFESSTDLIFDTLTAMSPMSHFNTTPYEIQTFYDHDTCYNHDDEILRDSLGNINVNVNLGLKCIPGRKLNNCNSQCRVTFCDKIKGWLCID